MLKMPSDPTPEQKLVFLKEEMLTAKTPTHRMMVQQRFNNYAKDYAHLVTTARGNARPVVRDVEFAHRQKMTPLGRWEGRAFVDASRIFRALEA